MKVIKRNGQIVDFNETRISLAIHKADKEVDYESQLSEDLFIALVNDIINHIEGLNKETISVEEIQDIVEAEMVESGYYQLVKKYILYRQNRTVIRTTDPLMKLFGDLTFKDSKEIDAKRENANIDGNTSMGTMLKYGSTAANYYVDNYVLPKHIAKAHVCGDIHIHDKDFYLLTETCCQIDLLKLLKDGFQAGHGQIREPTSIGTAAALACIAIQANQNEMHGGQAIPHFDYCMAPYVLKTFKKEYLKALRTHIKFHEYDLDEAGIQAEFDKKFAYSGMDDKYLDVIYKDSIVNYYLHLCAYNEALRSTDEATHQAMEALVHNLNTMHCLPSYEKIWVYDTKKLTLDLLTIGELYEKYEDGRYEAISLNRGNMQVEFKKITHVTKKDNNRRLIEVSTNYGQKACTTDNHLWLTNNSGNVVDDYPEKLSSVIMPRSIPVPQSKNYIKLQPLGEIRVDTPFKKEKLEVTKELAELLGYYVADGSIVGRSVLVLSTFHKVEQDRIKELVKICFGNEISYQPYMRTVAGIDQPEHRFNVGTYLARNIKAICGDVARQKKIPNEIFISSDMSIRLAFLNAYFSCDSKIDNYIEVSSASNLLVKQIQLILLSFGVVSKYSSSKDHKNRLIIPGYAANKIGIHLKKNPSFEIQREDLDYAQKRLRTQYGLAWFKDLPHRHTKNGKNQIRYEEAIEACKKHSIDYTSDKVLKNINVITMPAEVSSIKNSNDSFVYDIGIEDNENFMTEDGIFVHNSRAGAQVPFSSLNYGTDTSPEGRMVIKNLLLATEEGLGGGETAIFPVQIFKVKEGVNYEEGTPNHDLFIRAIEVSAKRLFPNFSFLDAPFNKAFYTHHGDWNHEVAYMGCRTRVMANFDKEHEVTCGRGNLSFTSINLPRLAFEAINKDREAPVDAFMDGLNSMIDLVIEQLLHRFKIQSKRKVKNYPFLMGNGVWIDSDKLDWDDEVGPVLKYGTLTIGFIGLAETLILLTGRHHGESPQAQELGLFIVKFMRERCDRASEEYGLNFSLIATPAEGLAGRFVALDRERYGVVENVTDKDYYTNSFHVPVWYKIKAHKKIEIEAPYHSYTNGGHITYVELDGNTANNTKACESIIKYMHDQGIGYGSFNHPVDRDPLCGYVGVIGDHCPRCGRKEGEAISVEKLEELRKIYPNVPKVQHE